MSDDLAAAISAALDQARPDTAASRRQKMNKAIRDLPRSATRRLRMDANADDTDTEDAPTTGQGLDGGSRAGEGQAPKTRSMNDIIRGSSLAQ
jgi:hypothetical protein